MSQVEVLGYNARQESFVLELLLVEIIDEKQDLDDVFFDNFGFEGWNLGPHLSLQQLHKDGQHVLVFVAIGGKLRHDLASEDDRAFTKSVLYILLYLEVVRAFLRIEGIIAQINQAPDLQLAEEVIDRLITALLLHGQCSLLLLFPCPVLGLNCRRDQLAFAVLGIGAGYHFNLCDRRCTLA